MIEHMAVKGYRLLNRFETRLQPGINVIIGANASGKSTLLELLRVVQSCALGTLSPFLEARQQPGIVTHPTGGGVVEWRLDLAMPDRRTQEGRRYTYGVTVEAFRFPMIRHEFLATVAPAPLLGDQPQALFEARDGRGEMYEVRSASPWPLRPNETMLGKATDPSLSHCSHVRSDLLRWRFTDLQINRIAPIRQPHGLEEWPELSDSGDNLAAVLLALLTNLDFQAEREELMSFLRSAVPEFETMMVTPEPIGKYVALQWRERGVDANLSAADLSDGVLRLLCLAVIALNPYPPGLICVDEPETGLHPKLLPLVGGLLQRAAERSQVIVLTHSPELLYDMPIDSIAVLRKRDGEAQIVWPRDHDLLYDLVTEEIAGGRQVDRERLRRAFTSGELDELG